MGTDEDSESTQSPITLRCNTKLADVSPCLAVEDVSLTHGMCKPHDVTDSALPKPVLSVDPVRLLHEYGLEDTDIDGCEISESWKEELASLIVSYHNVFSRDRFHCGEVKDFVHRIHLCDECPFHLPYRRIPPAHYQKLNFFFQWLNAKSIKDAHPLLQQADCLAALGGNLLFSSMDLTSGFYNIPFHVSDRHYTAFTRPMGLYEYNLLPQGLCNSPASFMCMMLSIFGDLNFSNLLCYLDDLLVFARSEQEALRCLEVVFSRLRSSNLKLAPKKCHFLRHSIKFLGHVISSSGVSVDEDKVAVISAFQKKDLMKKDGSTPSPKNIRLFLGMVLYYQSFIPGCSRIAKQLFNLTVGQKRLGRGTSSRNRAGTFRELSPQDWTPACDVAFEELKRALVQSVMLAHPDFEHPFILCTDASLDGIGAVLSQVPTGEDKAHPIAFASKSLSFSQANYPAHRLEFLAFKWSICDKFSHWLKGCEFTVWTDNNLLMYIMTSVGGNALQVM